MSTLHCRDCERPVNRGEAHLRSVNFEQVAYCPECWEARRSGVVPAQRVSYDEAAEVVSGG